MIRISDAPDHGNGWRFANIGLAACWIIQRLQTGCINTDQAIAELTERVDQRGQTGSEASDE